jgi:ribosomal protein S7
MLKAVKIGTKSHGIPFYIKLRKRYAFAIKWTLKLYRVKGKRLDLDVLSNLLIKSAYGIGDAIKKKQSVYRIASSNRYLIRTFR